ncbi:MAC/Perforin domain-containing protein [Fibrobacter sp. UWT2]|uniref:MAC/perforin domain-containing protein n=1 Tax=Fibrobacter sp. UWT2 TaxID=1896224 RepID=UPI00091C2161|nr:MAC/perforin domain-containing protein [Fibrobacter sp. UWT2]SHL78032.1 MAC/Perforin domain-containing protein [Fibrobacter sp. UWT2]
MSINTLKFSVAVGFACAATLGLTACSNSDDPNGSSAKETAISVEVLGKTVGDTLVFDMMDSTYDFKIKADGKWRIEDETEFIQSISEKSGNGDATVKIRMVTNFLDERFVGDLRIVFPEDTSLNKTITVVQKYSGDYDDNANDVSQSNKAYAMGYGYDMISSTEGYLDPSAIKSEVFDTKTLFEDGTFAYGPNTQTLDETTVTGSTISDISFKLGVKTKIEGGTALFSGEMKSSFDMSKTSYSNYEFALNYIDVTTQTITSEVPLEILADSLSMIVSAYYAINGLGRTGQKFPSTNAGFRRLIKGYGTHVVMGAKVGGRIRQSMTVDVSKVTSSYDLEVFAKAAYKGLAVKAEGSMESKMKQSFEENNSNMSFKVHVYGGDAGVGARLMNTTNRALDPTDVDTWKASVAKGKGALIGFPSDGLVPLYELIDETISDSTAKRKKLLKEYMESKAFASDFNAYYECGTVTEIDVPKIEDLDTNTLIKDIYSGGQLVAKATLEFVPLLNIKEKVMVIYPVINNKVRYNLGFYIGDKDHKPARVSWDGTDAAIVEYADMDFGAAKKIYIRGTSVLSTAPEGTETHVGTVEDAYLASKIINKNISADFDYNYPLVKIFDHVWIRQDYASSTTRKGFFRQPGSGQVVGANPMWRKYDATEVEEYVPLGWKIPSDTVFKSIENEFKKNGLSNIGKAMLRKKDCDSEKECGLLGFSAVKWNDSRSRNYYGYVKPDGKIGSVDIMYDASVLDYNNDWDEVQLRIIQE